MHRSSTRCRALSTPHKNRGLALLLMLSILVIALTTVVIARLSLNTAAQQRQAFTLKTLTETRDAIMAWTLTQPFSPTRPPGTLPCPDIDGDGYSDKSAIFCSGELGFVPYRTLGIPEPYDNYGASLWYAVSNNYTRDADATIVRNSSLLSPLFINNTANTMAFILISPGDALDNQNRANINVANRAQFLEGVNADADFNDYSDVKDAIHNDQLLGFPVSTFWSEVEERIFVDISLLLVNYMSACGRYPWASPLADADDKGDAGTFRGWLPITNTGGALCDDAIPAQSWVNNHWKRIFYYALCADIPSVNPPVTSCLNLGGGVNAKVILIGPGSPVSGKNRATLIIDNYLENENASPIDNFFQKTSRPNHTASFNDLIKIVVN